MEKIKYKDIKTENKIKEIDINAMTITHYISTSSPDRYREIMNPKGCNFEEYRKNPVVFFGHRSRDLPIARNEKIIIDDFGVLAVTKFDTSDFAKEVFRLNSEGFLNSWSIGFIPKKFQNKKVKNENGEQEYTYIDEWELMEYSSVPIPANPDAVNLLLKEIKDEKVKNMIEQYSETKIQHIINEIDKIKDNFTKIHEENTKNTKKILKEELAIFENRLVNKLFSLNKNILNIKMKGKTK
jgi:HK97 family phage prohead protease